MRKSRAFLFLSVIWLAVLAAGVFVFSSQINNFIDRLNSKMAPARSEVTTEPAQIPNPTFQIPHVPDRPFKLGLDLQGGTHIVYEADLSGIASSEYDEAMEGLRDVIERRVNLFGVSEPIVQIQESDGSWRLIVELAGIRDTKAAIEAIGKTPFLEFREPRPEEEVKMILEKQEQIRKKIEAKEELSQEDFQTAVTDPYFTPTPLTGRYLKKATLGFHNVTNEPLVLLEFDEEGAKIFADLTKKYIGKPIGIYLDGQGISAPKVQQEITSGEAQITGNFKLEEARNLVRNLNAGALPIPISILSQQTIEASLGEASLSQSFKAGLWGIGSVILFMVLVYRMGGVLAVLGLLVYGIFVLALFKLIPVTLTLAGFAGFILSFGMAVDANVLISERMREERKLGRDFNGMVREGFSRAWPPIRDGHITTLISTCIMFFMGTGFLQGFALTLGIGVLASLFSAVVFVRLTTWMFAGTIFAKWKAMWTR